MFTPHKRPYNEGIPTPESILKNKRVRMPQYKNKNNRLTKPYVKPGKVSASKVKAEILKMANRFHSTVPDATGGNFGLLQNQLYALSLTRFISQGDGDGDRTGDQVYLETLKIAGYVNTPNTSGAFSYRIIVGWASDQLTLTSLETPSVPYQSLFLSETGNTAVTNGIINPKSFNVLYDQHIDLNSSVANTADIQSFSASIRLDQKFQFKALNSVYGKFKNLIMVVAPYKVGGTDFTACGSVQIASDICFKNL